MKGDVEWVGIRAALIKTAELKDECAKTDEANEHEESRKDFRAGSWLGHAGSVHDGGVLCQRLLHLLTLEKGLAA